MSHILFVLYVVGISGGCAVAAALLFLAIRYRGFALRYLLFHLALSGLVINRGLNEYAMGQHISASTYFLMPLSFLLGLLMLWLLPSLVHHAARKPMRQPAVWLFRLYPLFSGLILLVLVLIGLPGRALEFFTLIGNVLIFGMLILEIIYTIVVWFSGYERENKGPYDRMALVLMILGLAFLPGFLADLQKVPLDELRRGGAGWSFTPLFYISWNIVHIVFFGKTYLESTRDPVSNAYWEVDLTGREKAILDEILKGRENQEISDTLGIKPSNLRQYVHRIYQKFQVASRLELIRKFGVKLPQAKH